MYLHNSEAQNLTLMTLQSALPDYKCTIVCCRWRSFLRGGSLALYMAIYAVGFLVNTLHLLSGFLSVLLYLSYMILILWAVYLAMGTVGFASSFLFTYKIFASVKAD